MPLSPEINALVHPFRTFADEASRARSSPATTIGKKLSLSLRRPLLFLLVMGAFVSFTAAGRLVLGHVAWALPGYLFVPLLHTCALMMTLALLGRGDRSLSVPATLDVAFIARAPWLVFLIVLSVVYVVALGGQGSLFSFFLSWPMIAALFVFIVWSGVMDVAFWRGAMGFSRMRTTLAVVLGYLFFFAPGVAWYLVTDQLQPLLFGGGGWK